MKAIRMALAAGICALAVGQSVQAVGGSTEERAEPLRVGTAHEALFDMALDKGGIGLAVGAGGAVFETRDSGATWQEQKPATRLSLLGVVSKGGRQVVVGQQGLIMTREYGKPWETAKAVTEQRLLGIDMNNGGVAVAVGAFGTILRSTDYGVSWQQLTVDWTLHSSEGIEPHLYVASVAEDGSITVAGEVGLILRLPAGSEEWQDLHKGDVQQHIDDASIFGMNFDANGNGYAVGQEGMILKSADGGTTWARMPSGTTEILLDVIATADRLVIATTYGLRESTDGGATWKVESSPEVAGSWITSILSVGDSRTVLTAGAGGRIVRVKL